MKRRFAMADGAAGEMLRRKGFDAPAVARMLTGDRTGFYTSSLYAQRSNGTRVADALEARRQSEVRGGATAGAAIVILRGRGVRSSAIDLWCGLPVGTTAKMLGEASDIADRLLDRGDPGPEGRRRGPIGNVHREIVPRRSDLERHAMRQRERELRLQNERRALERLANRRPLTAVLMGDPPPGRSALDQRQNGRG